MLALPSLTMPSSSAQLSSRDSWKYRSAASTELDITCDERAVEARVVEPAGPQDELAGDGQGFVFDYCVQVVTVFNEMYLSRQIVRYSRASHGLPALHSSRTTSPWRIGNCSSRERHQRALTRTT